MSANPEATRIAGGDVDPTTGEILRASMPAAPRQAGGALIQIEQQRAVAEIQARMLIARASPRDPLRALDAILRDCMRPTLAETAAYQYARGGTDIKGPSIRLLEAVARRWGNLATGIREVSRHEGISECVAFAWDLETGFYEERQFPVRHWRDRSERNGGGYMVTDERDIYELVANAGQRRKRSCLESAIPGDVVDAALDQCEKTLRARADTSPEAMGKMIEGFAPFGVTRAQIEQRIQRRIDAITPAQVVGLRRVYASLRDGMSVALDWFEPAVVPPVGAEGALPPPAPEGGAPSGSPVARRPRAKKAAGGPEPAAEDSPPMPPPDSAATPAPGPAAGAFALERRSLADYQLEMERATDAETAALVLDEARTAGVLADELAALTGAWRSKWEPAS